MAKKDRKTYLSTKDKNRKESLLIIFNKICKAGVGRSPKYFGAN